MTRPSGEISRAVGVLGEDLGQPGFLAGLVDGLQSLLEAVSSGPKTRKLVMLLPHDVAQKLAERVGGRDVELAGFFDFDRVFAEVGHLKRLAQQAAVGMGIGGDAARALGGELAQLCDEAAVFVEELFGLVALQPLFDDA